MVLMMNQPIKYNDFKNHQWILSYGDITRTIDFKQSDDYMQEVMQEMFSEYRDQKINEILDGKV